MLLAGAGGLLAAPAIVRAQGANGVALVIGNSKYQWEAPLPNVRRDAPDVARTFQSRGLRTELVQDAGRDAMNHALENFGAAAKGANFAAFYFAGHGVTWDNGTYLVPMDADLSDPTAVNGLVRVPAVSALMGNAAHRLLVLDNCRNSPADGWRQRAADQKAGRRKSEGGNTLKDPPDTLVLFSTAPGRIALDGPAGENSPFAAAILRQLEASSIDLPALPGKVRRDLLIATEGQQVLWDRSNYQQPFVLNLPRATPMAAPGSARTGGNLPTSSIIELDKAYAFAQQNGLPMPPGLIALRPRGNAQESQKVGSFKYTGNNQDASLLVVMAVEDGQTAELILVTRNNKLEGKWRFLRGALSGDSLECTRSDDNERTVFKWSDANAGKVTLIPEGHRQGSRIVTGSFTRLDG